VSVIFSCILWVLLITILVNITVPKQNYQDIMKATTRIIATEPCPTCHKNGHTCIIMPDAVEKLVKWVNQRSAILNGPNSTSRLPSRPLYTSCKECNHTRKSPCALPCISDNLHPYDNYLKTKAAKLGII